MTRLIGGIEGGGSKFRCAVAEVDGVPGRVSPAAARKTIAETSIPTTQPKETLDAVSAFFKSYQIEHLGVACFGPLGVNPKQQNYGVILDTPKSGWQGTDLKQYFAGITTNLTFQTDVVAAALAEYEADDEAPEVLAYVTVGTGIGVGILAHGRPLPGLGHSELGHIFPPRHAADTFIGSCPYHSDCLEGLASATALENRWGQPSIAIEDPQAWRFQAHYLGHLCLNLMRSLNPQRIVLGGGVMLRSGLLEGVRQELLELLGGYYVYEKPSINEIVQLGRCGADSGLMGALAL